MNETKKTIAVLAVIAAVILMIPLAYYMNYSKGEKIVNAVEELFNDTAINLVYIGRPSCSYCVQLQPILDKFTNDYNFTYNYINTDKLNSKQLDKVLDFFEQDVSNFGTPYLAIVVNGEVVSEQPGYVEAEELFEFLQTGGIIGENEILPGEETNLTNINYQEYNNVLESKTKSILLIAQSGCGACESAKPVLDEIAGDYEIEINWFDLRKIKSQEEYDEFMDSLDYYKKEQWGTPLMLIVEGNEVLDISNGFVGKDAYIEFLKKNGFIEE
jgi:predicted bacteriocin transport accessory protein